jgi:hypothetical protein
MQTMRRVGSCAGVPDELQLALFGCGYDDARGERAR